MLILRVSVACFDAFRADTEVALFAVPPVLVLLKLVAATPRALDASLLGVDWRFAFGSAQKMAGLALSTVDAERVLALLDALVSGPRADVLLARVTDKPVACLNVLQVRGAI